MADDQDIQIAVLQEQIKGVKEQQKVNAENTKELFMAQSLEFNKKLDALFNQMSSVNASLNRGKGAFTASLLLASFIGGSIAMAVEYFRK